MNFSTLVSYFEQLEATRKRLEMFEILSALFKKSDLNEIDKVIYLTQGALLPPFHGINIGMSDKYLLRAIAKGSGIEIDALSDIYREVGDLGQVAEKYTSKEGKSVSVQAIYQRIYEIAKMSGEGSVEQKIDAVMQLLKSVTPSEAKYIARFLVGKLRLGAGDATVLESLALSRGDRAIRKALDRAYHITSDLGLVAVTLFESGEKGIAAMSVQIGYPIRPALCERLPSSEEIVKKIGRCSVEVKYDGFRCQVHKGKKGVEIFSRNQERTTLMFPEIVEAAQRVFPNQEVILEGEALAYDEATGELWPFQVTSQRKRKHGIHEIAKEIPLKFFVFDILYYNGTDYTLIPYRDRRQLLFELIGNDQVIQISEAIETEDPKEIQTFFHDAIERGLEGIVAKRLEGPYAAGSRNFNWIKLKRSYKAELSDSVDLCIIGYYAGKGHRAQFGIGTVLCAVYDDETDRFKSVSKVGTGFSEAELVELKDRLDEIVSPEIPTNVDSDTVPDVWVYPKYVVTVTADEITRSKNHTAGRDASGIGYALRFPRVDRFIRPDKSEKEATTVSEIISLFKQQREQKKG